MPAWAETSIEYLKGVGPQRAALLQKELFIFTFGDLIQHYPFRHEDRTRIYKIRELDDEMPSVQLMGTIRRFELIGAGYKKRLVAHFVDDTGEMELVWFQGIKWVMDKLKPGLKYVAFGKPSRYGSHFSIAHPEIDPAIESGSVPAFLQPVYNVTEKLKARHIDSKFIGKLQKEVLKSARGNIAETLPNGLLKAQALLAKSTAIEQIHFPDNKQSLFAAQRRLKFEELFYVQLRLVKTKKVRQEKFKGVPMTDVTLLTRFYKEFLPFALTEAQKRVIREIHADMKSGQQMNRLLQGDVGSGKTIVAFIVILNAIGSGAQAALIAPTEILAQQHYNNLKVYADKMGVTIALLTGSTRKADRRIIHEGLSDDSLKLLVGTHALLEEGVKFSRLGLAIIDEQHRFGVAQRSRLWEKNEAIFPHVLVMTATPIPRTLAMTLYGDLEISTIDELPKGRKPIETKHYFDSKRLLLNGFLKKQIEVGRQVYIVYPLIEESAKLDLKHLMDGYESTVRAFPDVAVSIVHGKMKSQDKDFEMARFVKGETKIMVATTVIEVGVDVPNASVMVIESAERFGLSQLHQLRGRVGRGAEQSYCILMTDFKLSADSRIRIETMVRTNNGFEIAETDLKLRGPGDLMGTQQSGVLDLLIADLSTDGELLKLARETAIQILANDPDLTSPEHLAIRRQVESVRKTAVNWSRIS